MLLALLALFACDTTLDDHVVDPGAPPADPIPEVAAAPVQLPAGSAVVRSCYGTPDTGDGSLQIIRGAPSGGGGVGRGGGGYGSASSVGSSAKSAKPSVRPSRDAAGAADAPRPAPSPAPEPEAAAPAQAPPAATRGVELGGAKREDRSVADAGVLAPPAREAPSAGWGDTIYLSNDDSMSLASAQRVLDAAARGARVPTSQIRPHELLNYFSFDRPEVASGEMFAVHASAEPIAQGQLALALTVQGATPPRQPLDLTVVVDRSGSMRAEGRMAYTKRGLRLLADSLQRGDRLDVVLFDHEVCTPLEGWVSGRDDPELLSAAIEPMDPRGGTDIDKGLREAWRVQRARAPEDVHGRNRRVMLVTDAFLNTGRVDPDLVSEVAKVYEEDGIRLTGVGVGKEFNDGFLDMLTEKGKGAYVYLGSEAVVDRVFGAGFNSLTQTIAHDVRFALDLPDSLGMERFYGEEASTVAADVQPIHYYAGTSQVFLQDLKVRDGEIMRGDDVALTITWTDAVTGEPGEQRFSWRVGDLFARDRHDLVKARALIGWSEVLLAQSMGADPCGEPLATYAEQARRLGDDAEIAYVNSLVTKVCRGASLSTAVTATGGSVLKITVDADQPISGVGLTCGGSTRSSALSGSDTVARFEHVPAGDCDVVLQGAVELRVPVEVPAVDKDLRCLVRGGRVSCG